MERRSHLNDWAKRFVAGEKVPVYTDKTIRVHGYGRGEQETLSETVTWSKPQEVQRSETGDYAAECLTEPLYRYMFADGNVYTESVQQEARGWSGNWIALCLVDSQGNKLPASIWSGEEIYPPSP